MTLRPIIPALKALVTVEYRLGVKTQTHWVARGEYVKSRGFNIDVLRNGKRFAIRDGARSECSFGCNPDVVLLAQTLDYSIKGEAIESLVFLDELE